MGKKKIWKEKFLPIITESSAEKIILSFEDLFYSPKGFDLHAGFTDSDERHATNKKSMLKGARTKILAVDSSKFSRISFAKIGDLRDITTVVTDVKPEKEMEKNI